VYYYEQSGHYCVKELFNYNTANETKDLERDIENIDQKINHNAECIVELDEKIRQLLKQKEDERRKFLENETNNKLKYEELKNKYDDLLGQSKHYDKAVKNREVEADHYIGMKSQTAKIKEDLKM
jgi:DNA gyrase/topoisomerase IV subunit A